MCASRTAAVRPVVPEFWHKDNQELFPVAADLEGMIRDETDLKHP